MTTYVQTPIVISCWILKVFLLLTFCRQELNNNRSQIKHCILKVSVGGTIEQKRPTGQPYISARNSPGCQAQEDLFLKRFYIVGIAKRARQSQSKKLFPGGKPILLGSCLNAWIKSYNIEHQLECFIFNYTGDKNYNYLLATSSFNWNSLNLLATI